MTTKIQTFGGNIGIGTTDPGAFKLNVHGSLKTSSLVVNGVTDAHLPIGILGMWSGSLGSIPSGWALCDGNSYTRTDGEGSITTPDLKDRFIRGATGDAPSPVATGTTGGSNTKTLAAANLAPHSHGVSVSSGNANHNHPAAGASMSHTHGNSGTTQTQHAHGETGTTNTPHDHGNAGYSSKDHTHSAPQANMPHSHDSEDLTYPHRHYMPIIANRTGRGGPQSGATRTQGTTQDTGAATYSGNHSHNGFQTTPTHAHTCGNANVPHSHNTGSDNWNHGHSTANKQAPHTHQTGDGQAPHTHPGNNSQAPHSHGATSNSTGQASPFSVLNVYYALFYIMKI